MYSELFRFFSLQILSECDGPVDVEIILNRPSGVTQKQNIISSNT